MEMVKGVKQNQNLCELEELFEGRGKRTDRESQRCSAHNPRHGNRSFCDPAQNADGLIQCVYEKGVSGFDLKDVKEAASRGSDRRCGSIRKSASRN